MVPRLFWRWSSGAFALSAILLAAGCSQTPATSSSEPIASPNQVVIRHDAFDWSVATLGKSVDEIVDTYNLNARALAPGIVIVPDKLQRQSMQDYLKTLSQEEAQEIQDWFDSNPPADDSIAAAVGAYEVSDLAYMYDQMGGTFRVYRYHYPDHFMSLMVSSIENTDGEDQVYKLALDIDIPAYQARYQGDRDAIADMVLAECLWLNAVIPTLNFELLRDTISQGFRSMSEQQPYERVLEGVRVTKTASLRRHMLFILEPEGNP